MPTKLSNWVNNEVISVSYWETPAQWGRGGMAKGAGKLGYRGEHEKSLVATSACCTWIADKWQTARLTPFPPLPTTFPAAQPPTIAADKTIGALCLCRSSPPLLWHTAWLRGVPRGAAALRGAAAAAPLGSHKCRCTSSMRFDRRCQLCWQIVGEFLG